MAAIDDLTELVERAAAVEKVALSSKWKERAEVALLVARVGKNADECREDLARDVDHQSLSSRWVLLRRDYLTLGGQEPLPGQVAARAGEPPAADWPRSSTGCAMPVRPRPSGTRSPPWTWPGSR